MSKVLVEVPDDLMAAALAVAGPGANKSSTIRNALQRSVDVAKQADLIHWFVAEDPLADLRALMFRQAPTVDDRDFADIADIASNLSHRWIVPQGSVD